MKFKKLINIDTTVVEINETLGNVTEGIKVLKDDNVHLKEKIETLNDVNYDH